jgi:DNA-binding response OmpR family regulator
MDVVSQNILLIQKDPEHAGIVQAALRKSGDRSFEVKWVRSCSQGLDQLARRGKQEKDKAGGIAAVLIDLFLSDSDGIETFDRLFRAAPQIPILVLSASQHEEIAKLAVQRGAQDYLLDRPFRRLYATEDRRLHARARGERGCVVRRKGARTSHAQLHR